MNCLKTLALAAFVAATCATAQAQNLLTNGNLDVTYQQEIVPAFFLPKPAAWVNVGTRTVSGPYEDEMSSEPWAGPAPTPVTASGVDPDGPGGNPGDWAVFFKPFSGSVADGAATGHLYQDVPGGPGNKYTLTGWVGAEANVLANDVVLALDFLNSGGGSISSVQVSALPTLFVPNGEAFNYKKYTVSSFAPAGTVTVRARASMIGASGNPAGGGQALVVDDFELTVIPEPGCLALAGIAVAGAGLARRRK